MFFFYAILIFNKLFLKIKLFRLYYNNLLAKYFKIKKIEKLISRKFYKLRITTNNNAYIKEYNICKHNKIMRYCFYNKLKTLF